MIREIALPRGALLIEESAAGARSFAVGFWFPLGSRHEAKTERGFVHFVEHMVFKGSARRSAQDFAREVDRVGGYLNAFTERDTLCFHCVVPKAYWRLALDIMVDLVLGATFPDEEFERERQVIQSEILAAGDDPEEASHDGLLARLWPGDSLSRKIAGEVDDLEKVTRDALYGFYRRRLTCDHLIVSISGSVDERDVEQELSRLLDAMLPSDMAPEPYPPEPPPTFAPARAFEMAAVSQIYLYEALEVSEGGDPDDYYVLSVLNGALGESMSSRLFQNLREKQGLCYSVYSSFTLDRGVGLWMASASSSTKLFPRLLESLDAELDRLADGDEGALTEAEVEESMSRIAGSFDLALEDPDYRMKRIAKQKLCSGFVLDAEETKDKILAVDKPRVDAMAARIFLGRKRALFAYGRHSAGVDRAFGIGAGKPQSRGAAAGKAARRGTADGGGGEHG